MKNLAAGAYILSVVLLLVGCAPATVSAPTATSNDLPIAVTPVVGSVTVLSVPPGQASLPLRAMPLPDASLSVGKVKPGDSGKALGIDSSGKWMLVEIKQQTGWLPIQYLDYTIAQ